MPLNGHLQAFIPKNTTQQDKFIEKYPDCDGRGLIIAIIDSGVDVSLPGMQKTSTGIPKILDCFDFTGFGDIDTSTVKEADENNMIIGLSGRAFKIPLTWKNPSQKWHLGKKSLNELTFKFSLKKEFQNKKTENLQSVDETIEKMPAIVDCIVWFNGEKWQACIVTSFSHDLENANVLTNYRDEQEYGFIGDNFSYCITIHKNGNLIEMFSPRNEHGTYVAQVAAACYPEEQPARNGLAPGAQIISINVFETNEKGSITVSPEVVIKALLKCIELKVDIVNISFEITDCRDVNEILKEMTEKHGIIIVKSAGNAGPLYLSKKDDSINNEYCFIISSCGTLEMKNIFKITDNLSPLICYDSTRGPFKNTGSRGIEFAGPGAAAIPPPQWLSSKNQLFYGTSAAAPNVAGLIACLISALKKNLIKYSLSKIRLALSNTAYLPPDGNKLDFGEGIIQICDAFQYFLTNLTYFSSLPFNLGVKISIRGSNMKGIFLVIQEKNDINKTFDIKIMENFGTSAKISWILKVFPETADFIKYSQISKNNIFSVAFNTNTLKADSMRYAEIYGIDSSKPSMGRLFCLPVTVISPEIIFAKNYSIQKNLFLKNNIPVHLFFVPPFCDWKCSIEITLMNETNISSTIFLQYFTAPSIPYQAILNFICQKNLKFTFCSNYSGMNEISVFLNTKLNEAQQIKLQINFENTQSKKPKKKVLYFF